MVKATGAHSPFRYKVILVIFGVFIAFVILESGLRLGGTAILAVQEYRNMASARQNGTYRIVCVGESTTANQYPRFLEEILNQGKAGMQFSVIDKGVPGICTSVIVDQMGSYIAKYHPHMVVAMMGINDAGVHMPGEKPTSSPAVVFMRSLKTYKLTRLLWLRIVNKRKELNAAGLRKDRQGYLGLAESCSQQGRFRCAEASYKKALALDPHCAAAYLGLGSVYHAQKRFQEAEVSYKKALELNPQNEAVYIELGGLYRIQGKLQPAEEWYRKALALNPQSSWAYVGLGRVYRTWPDYLRQAEEYYRKALELDPQTEGAYIELAGLYQRQGKREQAEACLKKGLGLELKNRARLNGALATIYEESGRPELARACYDVSSGLKSSSYNLATKSNYRRLKEILDAHGISFVCVQYPMSNVQVLKKMFEEQEGIIFVDNNAVFKKAVQQKGYNYYFTDMFGGEFGHCTDAGNRLLAGNIANTIVKEAFHKE